MHEGNVFGIPVTVVNEAELIDATGGTGRHVKMLIRVADMDDTLTWPALRARRYRVLCERCREVCWNDPAASIYPAGEEHVCTRCMGLHDGYGQQLLDATGQ